MRVLCIGNCTEDTDHRVSEIASANNSVNHGLISDLDGYINIENIKLLHGYYHTSFIDLSYSRLKLLSKRFDKVLIIDQPIEQWNTSTEFYDTINFALKLDNVEWQNRQTRDNFLYWTQLVKDNKSLCIWPFVQMNSTVGGKFTLCCVSDVELDNTNGITDFHSTSYKTVRQKMLDNIKLPDHCSSCYHVESNGIASNRTQQTVEWAIRLNLKSVEDLKRINTPVSFEIGLDNTCNLMCRMCAPSSSNLIEKEYKELGIIASDTTYSTVNLQTLDELLQLETIEKLYFTGGEPTANRHFQKFLQKCIDQGKTNFLLQINTNCHKISSNFLNLIKHFTRVEFFVSVDAYGKANDYVRWNSNWDNLNNNIQRLIDTGAVVSFNVSVSLYSIFSLSDLVTFLDKTYPGHYISFSMVYNVYPYIVEYSTEMLEKLNQIKNLDVYKNDANLIKSYIDGFIENAKKSQFDRQKLQEFFNMNDALDASRNSQLIDYIPELEEYRNLL